MERQRIQQILSGDTKAFKSFINDYERLVAHIVFRMVRNETDREEICQEVFIRIYRNLHTFQFQSKISTWVGRIAYRTALNYLDKKKVPLYDDLVINKSAEKQTSERPDHLDGFPDSRFLPDAQMTQLETSRFLRQAIESLPPHYRAVLTLYHLSEMSYAEISEILDLPEGTVKSHLFRARKRLKEDLLEKFSLSQFQDQ